MLKNIYPIKKFLADTLFPKFCLGCGKEGSYLCQDCLSLIGISEHQYCPFCNPPKITSDGKTCLSCRKSKHLTGLYSATSYQEPLVKKMIHLLKYQPFAKELSKPLSSLIIAHLKLLGKDKNYFNQFVLIPVPLHKKQIKKRGFNQSEEIAKEISLYLNIPIISNALSRTKQTASQTKLNKEERKKNVKGAFKINPATRNLIKNKNILVVDDVFTTGSTIEECAKVLRQAGTNEVWGMTVAREEL